MSNRCIQVEEILLARLGDLDVFEAVGLKLLARKAVNAAGDLRAALKICQRYTAISKTWLVCSNSICN